MNFECVLNYYHLYPSVMSRADTLRVLEKIAAMKTCDFIKYHKLRQTLDIKM